MGLWISFLCGRWSEQRAFTSERYQRASDNDRWLLILMHDPWSWVCQRYHVSGRTRVRPLFILSEIWVQYCCSRNNAFEELCNSHDRSQVLTFHKEARFTSPCYIISMQLSLFHRTFYGWIAALTKACSCYHVQYIYTHRSWAKWSYTHACRYLGARLEQKSLLGVALLLVTPLNTVHFRVQSSPVQSPGFVPSPRGMRVCAKLCRHAPVKLWLALIGFWLHN